MTVPLVLDAAGLDAMGADEPPQHLRALLAEAYRRGRDVLVPAVVCAETARGVTRTRRMERVLARRGTSSGGRSAATVVDTDLTVAKQVGAILHAVDADTPDLVDAHVVAACVPYGGGVVVTSDAHDIQRLSAAVPQVRVITRRPTG